MLSALISGRTDHGISFCVKSDQMTGSDEIDFDALLASSHAMLETRQTFPIDDLRQRCDQIVRPTVDLSVLSDLTALCLFYEDLLKGREEATSKLLFNSVIRDLRERIAIHGVAAEFFAEKADQLLSVRDCMPYVKRFHECLTELEAAVPRRTDDASDD
jgi:hypothetical protein